MSNNATDFARRSGEPGVNPLYFDASAWSYLAREPMCTNIVTELRRRQVTVLASVISAGEILKTRDADLRRRLSSLMLSLYGDGPLLERPMTLAAEAGRACLEGRTDFVLPQSGPGRSLLALLHQSDASDQQAIVDWLENLDGNHERFLDAIRPEEPDRGTRYYSGEMTRSEPFLRLLAELPAAQELNLSLEQVALLTMRVDTWRAVAGTVGYIVTQAMAHSPKQGGTRPGGPDMWQVVYLGVATVFVSSDVRLLEAARAVSSTLSYPRCVISTRDFLEGIATTPRDQESRCRVCGSSMRTAAHAFDPTSVSATL